eukprot:809760_1
MCAPLILILVNLLMVDGAIVSSHDCIRRMALPCNVANRTYVEVNDSNVILGTFGDIHTAYELFPNGSIDTSEMYSIKFARNLKSGTRDVIENEACVTNTIYFDVQDRYLQENLFSLEPYVLTGHDLEYNWPPTISCIHKAFCMVQDYELIVMVMNHHLLGDADLADTPELETLGMMKRYPQGFVWKMLWDMSFVLSILNNEYCCIDGDVKLKNIVIAGDLENYTSTTFIKLDYGLTVSMEA